MPGDAQHHRAVLQRAGVEERAAQVVVDGVAGDVREVGGGVLGGVLDSGLAEHVVVGHPDAATGAGGGAAVVRRLLHEDGVEAVAGGGEGGGHARRARPGHDDVS